MIIFYTPDISGTVYTLNEVESKHCIRVLRHSKGDVLHLVDGKGGWYVALITDPNPKRCTVEVSSSKMAFEKRDYYLHVAIAPTKNIDRFEWFLEKATEIGIDEITPLLCEHSERKQIKHDRLEKVVVAAMKQSLKAYVPKLNALTRFDDFLEANSEDEKYIAHCEDEIKPHLKNLVKPGKRIVVLIGPEGDFSTTEIRVALQQGFKEISLGKSRLRTETAGLAATHIVNLMNEL
jgi:16S rRNA (uracil1498-N3)-methyltransferase